MTEFTIVGVAPSVYVRAAAIVLEERGAEYRLRQIAPASNKTPEFLKQNPFGRMPVFLHGDFELYETQAILRYVARILPGRTLIPERPTAEARMNQLCGITDCYVMPHLTMGIAFPRLIAPRIGLPVNESQIEASIPPARICLAEIARLLGDQQFLCGEEISLADLLLGAHLAFFTLAPEGPSMLARHAALQAWLDRMNARPSFQNTTPPRLAARAESCPRGSLQTS